MESKLDIKTLSDLTVFTKYARFREELGRRETWDELVTRNKEMHLKKFPDITDEIEKAYKYVYDKKVLPSMRSMQFSGKSIEISPNRIYNCGYLPIDDWRAFSEIMFLLLGGTGVGYSVQRHHVEQLPLINKPNPNRKRRYLIGDSIEGWADAIKILMKSYFFGGSSIIFDFDDIRPKGAQLVTSGGKAPGPQPLKECVIKIRGVLDHKQTGDQLSTLEVHDIVCYIADAVLAGGIRRAALISLFSADDDKMLTCKFGDWWERNPQRGRSNNSAVLLRHKISKDFFIDLFQKIKASGSGEPGFLFSNDKDYGTNPCGEISLKPFQFCNLTEVNVSNVSDQEELNARCRAAALIGTLQASYTEFHYLRSVWQRTSEKDALIGVGMTGIASHGVMDLDMKEASKSVKDENARIADLIGINKASRTTTVKPSGTASLVLGTSSGIHAWFAKYYIRRMRVGKNEILYNYLATHHPNLVVDDYFRPHDTAIIEVPQKAPNDAITRDESIFAFLSRIKKFNTKWVYGGHRKGENYNNVSATVFIKENEWEMVGEWMWENRKYYNGLSVLPYDGGSYIQAPFEEIDAEEYAKRLNDLSEVDVTKITEDYDNTDLSGEVACGGGACTITSL
ncbi:MAG TPA: hypothetical protein P5509_07405 [Bacteroidales bacterium]|nr:hypothetical protein [Bacteroidales bacterium]